MANSPSARKRARQSENHRQHNAAQRSYVRTMIKRVLTAIQSGDKSAAEVAYKEAVPAIDRSVTKGIMHSNKAARHKSRLGKHVKNL
ncbi:MAG: 30S ribosomal protein S20 [Wenzhouxiangellaceae bacterium]|nr:30S ribosomal protein S20 [Wenzhouxiangellaceae bacterium]